MDINLGSILEEASAAIGNLGNTQKQLDAVITQGTAINEAKQRSSYEAANAMGVKVEAELGEVARQEASRKAIAARIGTDPSRQGWMIGKKADEVIAADAGMAAASEQIKAKDSVSFLQNPIGWIGAQLSINDDIQNYNFFARQKNRAEETAKQLEQMTHSSFQTSNALSATTTEAYINAMKILGAHQYQYQGLEAAAQGARWNMEGILAASNLGKDKLQIMFGANSAAMQEKQYQAELARLRLAQDEAASRKEARDEKKDEDSLITKFIQDGYFNFTGKQMDPLSTKTALILFKAKQPDVMGFFNSGLASSKVTGGEGSKPVISLSPYEASNYVGQGKVTNMSPAMSQVGEQLTTWRTAFTNPAVQTQYPHDPKDPKGAELAFNRFVDDQRKQHLANVRPDSIYAPYPIQKVAQLNPKMGALPVWKNVLEPASRTGVDVNDPNLAMGIVTAAMREGKLSYVDAVDLSLLYANGLALNNQTRNFIAFGMAGAQTYNSPISIPGTMGKTTVNMADQRTLATALNRAEAINAQYQMQNQPKPLGRGYVKGE